MATKAPITGTAISVLGTDPTSPQVFYQTFNGITHQSVLKDSVWGQEELSWNPVALSPLASVSLDDGKETRVFYVDADYFIQEYILSPGHDWHEGDLGTVQQTKAIPNSRLGAVSYYDGKRDRVHLFYQDYSTLTIKELINTGSWSRGTLDLAGVVAGTAITAVSRVNRDKKREITMFYQTKTLFLKSHIYDGGWAPGPFDPGIATGRTPISATLINTGEIQVYWRDPIGRIAFNRKPDDHWKKSDIPEIAAGIVPGFELAVVGWEKTKNVRIYIQDSTGKINEWQSGTSGLNWSKPNIVVASNNA